MLTNVQYWIYSLVYFKLKCRNGFKKKINKGGKNTYNPGLSYNILF